MLVPNPVSHHALIRKTLIPRFRQVPSDEHTRYDPKSTPKNCRQLKCLDARMWLAAKTSSAVQSDIRFANTEDGELKVRLEW